MCNSAASPKFQLDHENFEGARQRETERDRKIEKWIPAKIGREREREREREQVEW